MVCSNCGEPLEAHDVEFSFADREAALAEAG
jgi:hypothetical protein